MDVYLTEKDWKKGNKIMEVDYTQGTGKLELNKIATRWPAKAVA